jgi:hypothetical protein
MAQGPGGQGAMKTGMQRPQASSPSIGRPSQTVYWIIAILLAVIATGLWMRPGGAAGSVAWAQSGPLAGARGVYAFTGPIDRDQYGLFMLDVDQGTIWCYAFDRIDGTRKLRLVAARTWIYDRYLKDFNNAPPDFRMVQNLVSQQRMQGPTGEEELPVSPASEPPPAVDGRPE